MSYLVVYKEGGEEKKDITGDANSAATFIEDLIRDKKISTEEISLHEMTKVDYDVKHVPVVTIGSVKHQEEDEFVAAQPSQVVEGIEDAQEASTANEGLEVFTFES